MNQDNAVLDLINKMKIIDDEDDVEKFLDNLSALETSKAVTIAFLNAHALNLCYKNPAFLEHLTLCDYVFRDGIGVKILFKLLGREPGLNLNGTDLIPRILKKFHSKTVSLYGTEQKYLDISTQKIQDMGVNVLQTIDGFQTDEIYNQSAVQNTPNLIILAMGMPKQERVAVQIAREINAPTVIICGGAILDFIGGKVKRAPEFFCKYGIEWLYRLLQEPRRLFKRYVIGNFVMLYHAVKLAIIVKNQKGRIV